MKIAVGSDHGGYPLNETIIADLEKEGHTVVDFGTHDGSKPDDYPDYSRKVGDAVQQGEVDRGIIVCGSGVGASVAANKIHGVRAGLCHDTYSAHQGVEHDNMNVLCLGARIVGVELARELVKAFVAAKFSGEERHVRRLVKVEEMEREGR
jgi:RpiB/LacA/LacB family sugar-phosphate isomerase